MSEAEKQLRSLSDDVAALLNDQYEVLRSLDLDDRFSEVALATEFWDRVLELDAIEETASNTKTKRRLEEMFMKLAEHGAQEIAKFGEILTAPTINNLAGIQDVLEAVEEVTRCITELFDSITDFTDVRSTLNATMITGVTSDRDPTEIAPDMMHDGFRLLTNVERYQSGRDNAKSAASLYRRGLKGSEEQLDPEHHDASDHKVPLDSADTTKVEAALRAKLSRKRTKTGCLTCRKRRIRCGEERPVCKNCIKSKRHCEGYSQRVVFEPPTFEYRAAPNGGAHITFQAGPMATPMIQMQPGQMPYILDPGMYAPQPDQFMPFLQQPGNGFAAPIPQQMMPFPGYLVRPQPGLMQQAVPINYVHAIGGKQQQQTQPMFQEQFAPVYDTRQYVVQQQPQPAFQTTFPLTYDSRQQETRPQPYPTFDVSFTSAHDGHHQEAQSQPRPVFQTPFASPHDSLQDETRQDPQFQKSFITTRVQPIPASVQPVPASHFQTPSQMPRAYSAGHQSGIHRPPLAGHEQTWPGTSLPDTVPTSQAPAASISPPRKYEQESTPISHGSAQSWDAPTYKPRPELNDPIDYQPTAVTSAVPPHNATAVPLSATFVPQPQQLSNPTTPEFCQHESQVQGSQEHSQWLADAAVEVVDDEYYDVDSDEDMDIDNPAIIVQNRRRQHTLNNVLMQQHFDMKNMQIRRYDTFLQDNMLAHYRVEWHANPLKNPATARVFAHFISATGPSLSVFERHPVNSGMLFTEGIVPFAQQGLWTYTMPMAALHHQGLLHAMLALSSLHIARLQNGDTTPSMRHYAWALKRIHACVGSRDRKKRLRVTTIAASMLLGFYEVMTADHMKWNTHLAGAKQLFVETDFAGMTRQYRQLKREKVARDQAQLRRNSISAVFNREEDAQNAFNDVDEAMISTFVGHEIRYEGHRGYVEAAQTKIPEELDLSNFETLKDLFWWYCKQDAFQCIVSGNPLLMDYHRWLDCPPRASMNRADAVYGSSDHLMLLLGRIADFAAKDRVRKLRQMALQGGQWVPAPGMNIPRPPQPPPGAGPPADPPPQAPPMFFGMAPPPKSNVQMPSSYNPVHETPTAQHSSSPEVLDLQAATAAALEEYGKIRAALRAFVAALSGDAFQPLDADCHTPLDTSFGPALFYRSYDIGCLWEIYNMCEIIAIRSHPYMHPAAHVAAGLAAKDTAFYANEIGRIAAGIVPGPANEPLNPTLGSSLCESCMPSFFAAIQYQRPDQRHETVMRIYGIAIRTGWGSAELIGKGIETSWVRAGEMGRGPPYQRVEMPRYSDDPRLNRSWERHPEDPNAKPEEMDDSDRRLVPIKPNARLNWAIGVIGLESDVTGG